MGRIPPETAMPAPWRPATDADAEGQRAPAGRPVAELCRALRLRSAVQAETFTQELHGVLCAPDAPRLTLEPAEQRAFEQALASAFPAGTDLARAVREHLHENLDAIAHGAGLREIISRLAEWGRAQERLPDLIAAAVREAPGNPDLQDFLCCVAAAPGPAQDDNPARARLRAAFANPPASPAVSDDPACRTHPVSRPPDRKVPPKRPCC